jgi:hypothetical protein
MPQEQGKEPNERYEIFEAKNKAFVAACETLEEAVARFLALDSHKKWQIEHNGKIIWP